MSEKALAHCFPAKLFCFTVYSINFPDIFYAIILYMAVFTGYARQLGAPTCQNLRYFPVFSLFAGNLS
jgi:hypothetical protein